MYNKPELNLELCREVAANCASIRLRKTANAVSRHYGKVQAPTGLTGTQFSLLVIVGLAAAPTVTQLATLMGLNQTTLSRNLVPLKKRGLIAIATGSDRRTRLVELTGDGRRVLNQALQLWKQAQGKFLAALGQPEWDRLSTGLAAARVAVGEAL